MNRPLVAGASVLVLIGLMGQGGHSAPPDKLISAFMQMKLDHAQETLEAIALNDFEGISRHAQKLSLLALDEQWMVIQTPEYRMHSDDFKRHCDAMAQSAKQENLDGATLAYMQMTMSCVNCHKYTRDVRTARAALERR